MSKNPNLEMTIALAGRLGRLRETLVFVGGCATGLLITDPASAPVRPTRDVDVIAETISYGGYHALSERLREIGFKEDINEGAPLCRWIAGDIKLDVMPTDPQVLGFTNRWYSPAAQSAERFVLTDDISIRIVTAPYFLATKLEAFATRGNRDVYSSHDLEDILAVIDGRPGIVQEALVCQFELRQFLTAEFNRLLSDEEFHDALPRHFAPDEASQNRIPLVIERLRSIAGLSGRRES